MPNLQSQYNFKLVFLKSGLIFKENVQEREPELLRYRNLHVMLKMKRMAIKIPIKFTTTMKKIMMKYNSIDEILKGAHNATQHQNSAH